MTDSEVQLLLFDLVLIIVLARLLGAAAKRIGQPPVLGEIVAGLVLGPTIWGTTFTTTLFPATLIPPLTALADLGLALFMFVVGYEVDLGLIRGRERVAGGVALGSIALPLALGMGLGVWLAHQQHVPNAVTFVLFFGTAMSITAFPVLARILTDRGLHRTRIGGLALASASMDDVLAWILLAVVVAAAGASAGHHQWRLALAPVYAALMIFVIRPLLRRLAGSFERAGSLSPTVLTAVLVLMLLSAAATDWMGVKFIFGAFIFGIAMPRNALALRTAILGRLEQVSVLVLLPVFFVIAGLRVNLRGIGLSGLADLGLIMVVAVVGKFGGAYYGARLTGVRRRQAGALAALMNTRGLTELVILTVGLQLGILNQSLYSLMVVMAVVTTGMAGPLLRVIYPPQIMERDIAEADRAVGGQAAHRIAVLVEDPATAGPLVDVGVLLTASRAGSELVLSHLVPHRGGAPSDVGAGIGGELLAMTRTMNALHELAARGRPNGITAIVQSRLSDDVAGELPGYLAAADPDVVVVGPRTGELAAIGGGSRQLVIVRKPPPAAPPAAAVRWARGADADAAVQVAAEIAAASGLGLVLCPASRPSTSLAADLTRRGIVAIAGPEPDGAIIVGSAGGAAEADLHLAVVAGSNEASDDLDHWTEILRESKHGPGKQPVLVVEAAPALDGAPALESTESGQP